MQLYIKVLCAASLLTLGGKQQATPVKQVDLRAAVDVAAYLSRASGIPVYVDSRLTREKVPMPPPSETVSAENVGDFVAKMAKALPTGATWAKLLLPPMPKGKFWKADDVIAYALSQATLYGKVGAVEPEKVEVISQQLTMDKAGPVVAALDLKPVYIVTLDRNTFAGSWSTTFGEMHLKQSGNRVTGTYTSGRGEIQGTVNGRYLKFRWHEADSRQGGPGAFTLAENGESFSGEWAYDGREDNFSSWSGTRISRR